MTSGPLLIPAGVYIAGNATGGNGDFWRTFAGNFVGTIAGAAASVPFFQAAQGTNGRSSLILGGVGVTLAVAGPLVGSILGYELSNDSEREALPPGPVVVPSLALAPSGGATAGVSGTF